MSAFTRSTLATLILATLAPFALAQGAREPSAVTERLLGAGYVEVREVEFDDGLWEAEVRRADGRWAEIAYDSANDDILDAADARPLLTAQDIEARVLAAGYGAVRDIERDGAVFDVEAIAADGRAVELRLAAHDGRVLHEAPDAED